METTIYVFQQAKNLQFFPVKFLKNKRNDTSILKKNQLISSNHSLRFLHYGPRIGCVFSVNCQMNQLFIQMNFTDFAWIKSSNDMAPLGIIHLVRLLNFPKN